jgi:hypothetical protein
MATLEQPMPHPDHRDTAPALAPTVMLLTVWTDASRGWQARIVMPDARAQEFASPFALARFLALGRCLATDDGAAPGGPVGLR